MIILYQCFIQIFLTTCLTTIWCFLLCPLSRTKKWASIFLTLALNRGCTVLYLTTENLGDLHAMIPGFTDLIGVFAIKVDSTVDNDGGFITITRFFPIYQSRLQHTSSCSKIPVVPPLSGELFALHHLFDIIHPSFFSELMAESDIFIVILTFFMFLLQVWFPLWQSAQASVQCIFPWISANR